MTKPYYFNSEPEWLKIMPAKALVSVRDVKNLFGFASEKCLHKLIEKGLFPKPDARLKSGTTGFYKIYWYPSTLRKENERRKPA